MVRSLTQLVAVRFAVAAVASAALALAAASPAAAGLPKPAAKTIVPGKSIGGLGFGGSQASVEKAWGPYPGGTCEQICTYGAPHGGAAGEVRLESADSVHYKAFEVLIRTGIESKGAKDVAGCDTPLVGWKTSKGIHLCSKVGELKKAYPGLRPDGASAYVLKGPGQAATIFSLTEDKLVFLISIVARFQEGQPGE